MTIQTESWRRFEVKVDPDGLLTASERARRARIAYSRFAATTSPSEAAALFDPEHVLPFANLEDAHKVRKRHGMRYQRAL